MTHTPSATETPVAADVAERRRVTVGPGDVDERVDKVLAAALGDVSRNRIKALMEAGLVTSDGRTIDNPSGRVKHGQSFEVLLPPPAAAEPVPQAIALDIVHEDEAVIVIDKPAGLVVHPAAGNLDGTLVNALLAHCGAGLSGIGGVARPGIVHRLDKDTSGLMVVAKTDQAHAALSAQFADRTLSRTYLAVVRGVPRPTSGRIDAPIGRSSRNRKKMAVVARGKSAQTDYRVLRAFGTTASLVECALATGRTHQIRVHMASIGHPLVGDPLYGGRSKAGGETSAELRRFPRQALHAARLTFRHPLSKQMVSFESGLSIDIKLLIGHLVEREKGISD